MPRLSDTMTEGTVSKWLKHPGDEVKKGEPLVEIETDKANIELEAYASGKLARIVLKEGQSAPVGELIGEIALPGDSSAPTAPEAPTAKAPPAEPDQPNAAPAQPESHTPAATAAEAAAAQPSPESPGAAVATTDAKRPEQSQAQAQAADGASSSSKPAEPRQEPEAQHPEGRFRASPLARRLARERGVDLASIHGSGPQGRIQKEDIEEAKGGGAAAQRPSGPDQELTPLSRMQQTIARRMVEAKTGVPHFYVSMEVDMRKAVEDLAELNASLAKEDQPTINDLIVRACALCLRDYPDVNASYQDGQLVRNHRINIGLAVAVPNGLIVPVVRDADSKRLLDLARDSKAVIKKMRDGKAEIADYEGGTFSVSNLGMYGVSEFAAIINPPQSAILAVGAVLDKVVVVDGQVAISKRCTLTLSADHRVFYGATAAEFLRAVKQRLEKPLPLFV